ncbi:MAG: hypothetical protein JJT94_06305 [Bernardetiaceae bacterium]|nr:hypothetical protein [Bernardetiaceae bacterium]
MKLLTKLTLRLSLFLVLFGIHKIAFAEKNPLQDEVIEYIETHQSEQASLDYYNKLLSDNQTLKAGFAALEIAKKYGRAQAEKAITYFEKAEQHAQAEKSELLIAEIYIERALVEATGKRRKDVKILEKLEQAIKTSREQADIRLEVMGLYRQGFIAHAINHRRAGITLEQAFKLAQAHEHYDYAIKAARELSAYYKAKGKVAQAQFYQNMAADLALPASKLDAQKDSISNLITEKQLQDEILLNKELELQNEQLEKQRIIGLSVLLLLILGIVVVAGLRIRKQKKHIEEERAKSDRLLLNILPLAVADELKTFDKVQPKLFNSATVLFTDFKGFTQISEQLSPRELIEELDYCFHRFDDICEKHGIEKIKTIGDAYMCAAGVPLPSDTHAINAVRAGIEMQAAMLEIQKKQKAAGKPIFELRLGIHTGAIIAGVIGKRKFAYDIWGDTVNVAARMESAGEPGKVNISETTYERVRTMFDCAYRGELEAKNKGKMKMYFVEKEK